MGQEAVATNGTGAAAGSTKPHAVVIPYPLQGHVIPAAHLALRLAACGFAVTFVNTESVHQQTARALGADGAAADGYDIFAGVRASSSSPPAGQQQRRLDVRYELVSDGFPLGFDRSLNRDQFMEGVLHVLPAHVEELLRRVIVDPVATCLVADTFFVWPATLARKLGVPYVSFWTEPALIFTLYYHMDLLAKHGHFKCKDARAPVVHVTINRAAIAIAVSRRGRVPRGCRNGRSLTEASPNRWEAGQRDISLSLLASRACVCKCHFANRFGPGRKSTRA